MPKKPEMPDFVQIGPSTHLVSEDYYVRQMGGMCPSRQRFRAGCRALGLTLQEWGTTRYVDQSEFEIALKAISLSGYQVFLFPGSSSKKRGKFKAGEGEEAATHISQIDVDEDEVLHKVLSARTLQSTHSARQTIEEMRRTIATIGKAANGEKAAEVISRKDMKEEMKEWRDEKAAAIRKERLKKVKERTKVGFEQ